jgi:hypothetical protein
VSNELSYWSKGLPRDVLEVVPDTIRGSQHRKSGAGGFSVMG